MGGRGSGVPFLAVPCRVGYIDRCSALLTCNFNISVNQSSWVRKSEGRSCG